MDSAKNLKVKKFDGTEYSFWKAKTTNALMFMELDNYLEVKAEATDPASMKKDKKALAFIKDSLSDSLFRTYNQSNTKDLWNKIKEDYGVDDAQMLFVLRNKFLS